MLPALKLYGKHYGHNYRVISEKSKCKTLRFYATIESRYGGNRFTVVVRIRNGNFFMAPTVQCTYVGFLLFDWYFLCSVNPTFLVFAFNCIYRE